MSRNKKTNANLEINASVRRIRETHVGRETVERDRQQRDHVSSNDSRNMSG